MEASRPPRLKRDIEVRGRHFTLETQRPKTERENEKQNLSPRANSLVTGLRTAPMADAMALASARAESAQIVAQKDADIARLKYDLLVERGEKERLSKVGENLGRINSALEGELETCLELLRLERGKTARLSAALTKARAFRDKVDTMRHEMQRGVVIAFNQLSRAATALDGEMHSFFGSMNNREEWNFDFDDDADGFENTGYPGPPNTHETETPPKVLGMAATFERMAMPDSRTTPGKKEDLLSRVASEY